MKKLLAVLIFCPGLLFAGGTKNPLIQSTVPLGLDSLQRIALKYNPDVRRASIDTRINRIGKANAVGSFLPTVTVGLQFSENQYYSPTFINPDGSVSTYPITYTDTVLYWDENAQEVRRRVETRTYEAEEGKNRGSSMYLSLQETIFQGGQRLFQFRRALKTADFNDATLLNTQKILDQSVAQNVVLVLTGEKMVTLAQKLLEQRRDLLELAQARFEVGTVTQLDVLQAEIDVGSAENDSSNAARNLQAARENLNELLGINLKSSFPLEEIPMMGPLKFDLDGLVETAYKHRTDLRMAELSVGISKDMVRETYSGYLPTATAGVTFSRSEQSGASESFTLSPRSRNTSYSLSAHWTLFDGLSRESSVVSARIARDKAYEEERALRLSIEKEVRDAYYNLQKVFDQSIITEKNRDLAEKTLDLERERYRLGATSQLNLRSAQLTYTQAETENLSKILEYHSQLIALELAVGKKLR
ncbi:TolC family protein [bacterium]|nr:TolC family protein [bacterium]